MQKLQKGKRQRVGLNTGPSTSETHVLPLSHQAMLANLVKFNNLNKFLMFYTTNFKFHLRFFEGRGNIKIHVSLTQIVSVKNLMAS